jgi:hypothetical protein
MDLQGIIDWDSSLSATIRHINHLSQYDRFESPWSLTFRKSCPSKPILIDRKIQRFHYEVVKEG